MNAVPQRLVGRLALDTKDGTFLGDMRIRLLEAIEQHGSLVQAAKAVPLSYKAAWDALEAMNNLADHPLVISTTGGKHGGGTRLTAYGRKMIAVYRALEKDYQETLDNLAKRLDVTNDGDVRQFQMLFKRMAVKTSARNQFVGLITAIDKEEVRAMVRARLDTRHEIVAAVTRESVENLGLSVGGEVLMLIKASAMLVLTSPPANAELRNVLYGEVAAIHNGPEYAEVTLALPEGRSATAITTHETLHTLGLALGKQACVVFVPSSVILATYV